MCLSKESELMGSDGTWVNERLIEDRTALRRRAACGEIGHPDLAAPAPVMPFDSRVEAGLVAHLHRGSTS